MTRVAVKTVVEIATLPHFDGLNLPRYATPGAAGMDIEAACSDRLTLAPNMPVAVPTGLRMAVPDGHEVQIRPRSGLAGKFGITVANAPGTVDSDYRGEVKVLLVNLGTRDQVIERGQRIAQMVVAPVSRTDLKRVAELDDTSRGGDGFGSTGR